MKKTVLLLVVFFCTLSLFALDPVVKFYLNDGKTSQSKIKDISEINFIKSNLSYSMEIFIDGSFNAYNVQDINSMEFIDSTKLKINLSSSSENINIEDIDSIIFVPNTCTEVVIGTQVWTCKNLDVDHYRNGDPIPQVTDATKWEKLTTGAWCYYNNDAKNVKTYGKLYNWYAVNDPRGLSPEGWHVPSDAEWTTLSTYLGESVAGDKLKEAGTTHWQNPNTGATNETGFTALPGGCRISNGMFNEIGSYGRWWSSTELGGGSKAAWERDLYYDRSNLNNYFGSDNVVCGFSIRCVKGSDYPTLNSITPTTAAIGDIITLSGTRFGATQGTSFVSFNSIKPQTSNYQIWSDTEIKVRVPAGATTGKVSVTVNGLKSNEFDFTVKPADPVNNEPVTIGTQVWTCKNLDVDHYRNGDEIPQVTDAAKWEKLTTGAWCYYNNDSENGKTYGKLYNWYAVNDPRGLSPEGWHVPSDAEWTTLSTYLGENVAGDKLKEAGTTHWQSPNTGATNETGFSALPGGNRISNGMFNEIGSGGYWWSSTNVGTTEAWQRDLNSNRSILNNYFSNKGHGFSIRCVKD